MTPERKEHLKLAVCAVAIWLLCLALMFWVMSVHAQAAKYRRAANGDSLNDLTLTPGATLPDETAKTLCAKTFHTGTVRHVTGATKQKACAEYGVPKARCNGKNYEIDHLISLELGGSDALTNLWPQPYPSARAKDLVEDALHRRVCAGKISLGAAQACISSDWTSCPTD